MVNMQPRTATLEASSVVELFHVSSSTDSYRDTMGMYLSSMANQCRMGLNAEWH